ncbi:MAG: radical SAM protein [Deltaproteobacteria bacterium]|nr:radical SAM protein [Deltaproteobacteria bacterium]
MNTKRELKPTKRILLTGVFGPFGVDDEYGRKENIMELFHNQVTKAQGAGSVRIFHRSFGLYFLAANVDADVTVLDFPSKKRFEREIKKGYDIVGISFIAPNFVKAREMARLTRMFAPDATIILGGHGAAIEGVRDLIDCDHVVRGEGIKWLRRFLGQEPDAPILHPILPTGENQSVFGVPIPGATASLLVPGVGCVNGCKFCSTSHFFGKSYTPFLGTGREVFETACQIADSRGTDHFFVMDENFLKDQDRAMDLIDEMVRHKRFFSFYLFSSAETISAFGIENLVRLGVMFLWIGVESKHDENNYAKNQGIDAKTLIMELRNHGITVLASGILCAEHHTPQNISEDIDYLVGLEPDMLQFMLLTPLPTTALYKDHKARGWLRIDLPYEEWHGQKMLSYHHPAFKEGEPERWMDAAFRQDFEMNSSSMYRQIETALRGYRTLSAIPERDECLELRLATAKNRAKEYSLMLPIIERFAVNELERERAQKLGREITATFGKKTLKEKLTRAAAYALAIRWNIRMRFFGDGIQPPTFVTRFKPVKEGNKRSTVPIANCRRVHKVESAIPSAAAIVGDEATAG